MDAGSTGGNRRPFREVYMKRLLASQAHLCGSLLSMDDFFCVSDVPASYTNELQYLGGMNMTEKALALLTEKKFSSTETTIKHHGPCGALPEFWKKCRRIVSRLRYTPASSKGVSSRSVCRNG